MEKLYKEIVTQTCKALRETISMNWGDRALCMVQLSIRMIALAKTMLKFQIQEGDKFRSL